MKTNLKKIIIVSGIVIIMAVIVYVCNSKLTFSKYFGKIIGRGVGEIAAPIFHIEYGENVSVTSQNTESMYFFSVKNFDGINNSQVDMKYQIMIENSLQDIDIKLFKEEEEISLQDGKTDFIEFNKEAKQDNYKMLISYNGSIQKVQQGQIKLNIYAEQRV